MIYAGKKVLILGLGVSGRSSARFLLKRGAAVIGVDRDRELLLNHEELAVLRQKGLQVCHESEKFDLAAFDFMVVSPGIPETHPLYSDARIQSLEVVGEIELACRHVTQKCLGITGTNGKTTTTMLVAHALNQNGHKARALGNIGAPLTEAVDEAAADEILVVELSSWQIETLHAKVFDGAAILNITPNHLDRHGTMEAYAAAKIHLKECLKPNASLFMGASCAVAEAQTFGFDKSCTLFSDGVAIYFKGKKAFKLPPQLALHDIENIMAAYALSGLEGEAFAAALSSFCKPPHRIEFVKNIAGVAYYDDSKGTSIDAVQKAVHSLSGPVHLIAGGVHKGASYSPWAKNFEGRVSTIYAIGQAAPQIERDLGRYFPVEICQDLAVAVKRAATKAKKGENVLLSPGCASFDMFKDYKHRGEEFKRLVQELGMKK